MHRVVIVGGPGSGKTLLAAALAAKTGAEHVELDGLWWQTNWQHLEREEFRNLVGARLRGTDGWIVDGNYLTEIADLVWPRADTLIWLDTSRWTAVRRAVTRTARRVATRERLWNGNRETGANLSPMSIWRLWKRWPSYDEAIGALLTEPMSGHLAVIRLSTPEDVAAFRI